MSLKKLNRRHQHFIRHYIITKNATESAKVAGYSEKNAEWQGLHLLKDPLVAQDIHRRFTALEAEYDLAEGVIKGELGKIALGERKADSTNVRALEILAKIKGVLKENDTTNVTVFSGNTDKLAKKRNIFGGGEADNSNDSLTLDTTGSDDETKPA